MEKTKNFMNPSCPIENMNFMSVMQNMNMDTMVNKFMNNFVSSFTPNNSMMVNNYSNDLINNPSFQKFLDHSHSSVVSNYTNMMHNPLVNSRVIPQSCPMYDFTLNIGNSNNYNQRNQGFNNFAPVPVKK